MDDMDKVAVVLSEMSAKKRDRLVKDARRAAAQDVPEIKRVGRDFAYQLQMRKPGHDPRIGEAGMLELFFNLYWWLDAHDYDWGGED